MRILFAHTNFPAQFGQFGDWLVSQGWDVDFITQRSGAASDRMQVRTCADHRAPSDETHQYLRGFEKAVITGQAFARAAVALGKEGGSPDVIMAHSGWGAGPFLKDVFPRAVFIPYFEWHYNYPNIDRTPEDKTVRDPLDARARNRVRNSPFWLDFSSADAALCPTRFQASQFPSWLRRFLTVVHDGVDTDLHRPSGGDRAILSRWEIPEDAEVLTSITRGMEPHRGFPDTMRALALLQKRRPKLHALIGGEDRVSYGAKLPEGDSWKKRMLAECDLDLSRIHFTGLLSRRDMVALMGASDAHLYLTVPFVLSWSLLDAMSTGCLIVASDTEPVREFMTDGETGLLVPPHDPEALAARVEDALDGGDGLTALRNGARRRIVESLDARRVIWPAKKAWIEKLVAARRASGSDNVASGHLGSTAPSHQREDAATSSTGRLRTMD